MKRGNQYPERAPDRLAPVLLAIELAKGAEADSWWLNAQPKNHLAAAAYYGAQVHIGPKLCQCYLHAQQWQATG